MAVMGKGSVKSDDVSIFSPSLFLCVFPIVTFLLRFLILDGYCSCGGQFQSLPSASQRQRTNEVLHGSKRISDVDEEAADVKIRQQQRHDDAHRLGGSGNDVSVLKNVQSGAENTRLRDQ